MSRRIPAPTAILAAIAVLATVLLVSTRVAQASEAGEFIARINSERTSRGIRAYAERSDLDAVAARQAVRMANSQSLYHNPNLGGEVGNWRAIAENVGRGGTVSSIHQAFMSSADHRDHILSTTYTEVGVGTARGGDGRLYVSEVFRLPAGAPVYTQPRPQTIQPRVRRLPRASRSAPRQPIPAVRKIVVRPRLSPLFYRLVAAEKILRREDPFSAFERATVYVRVMNRLEPY